MCSKHFHIVLSNYQITSATTPQNNRLLSLDFLRGLTMVFLTLESTLLFEHLRPAVAGTWGAPILNEFTHHPWHGLHFWDLVQPTFMFVAGTALAFSMNKRRKEMTWNQTFVKILKRCFWLFFWGVLDYAVRKTGLSFELWDVLTQLSFTTLVAFLIMDFPIAVQLFVSFLCLLISELLYRYAHVPGFDQPFVDQHNFGNYVDTLLMNKINHDGWVAINCISTSCHTIWGVLAGKILLSSRTGAQKMRYLPHKLRRIINPRIRTGRCRHHAHYKKNSDQFLCSGIRRILCIIPRNLLLVDRYQNASSLAGLLHLVRHELNIYISIL